MSVSMDPMHVQRENVNSSKSATVLNAKEMAPPNHPSIHRRNIQ